MAVGRSEILNPYDVLSFEDVKDVAIATWASIGITADRGSQILQRLYEHGRCAEAAAEYTFLVRKIDGADTSQLGFADFRSR